MAPFGVARIVVIFLIYLYDQRLWLLSKKTTRVIPSTTTSVRRRKRQRNSTLVSSNRPRRQICGMDREKSVLVVRFDATFKPTILVHHPKGNVISDHYMARQICDRQTT